MILGVKVLLVRSVDYKHFLDTIFSSTGGAKKKGRNVAEVEGADEQYAEACEKKKEMDHQVGNAQFGRVGRGVGPGAGEKL